MFFNNLTKQMENDAVQQIGDRWYIKMGFAGFNTEANNWDGYRTKERAEMDILKHQVKIA